jgi:hypothetical protein
VLLCERTDSTGSLLSHSCWCAYPHVHAFRLKAGVGSVAAIVVAIGTHSAEVAQRVLSGVPCFECELFHASSGAPAPIQIKWFTVSRRWNSKASSHVLYAACTIT